MVVDDTTRETSEYMLSRPDAGITSPGAYAPAGENQGLSASFTARQVAHAFDTDVERVRNAMRGELGLGPEAQVDSHQAQQLAEALLTDRSIELRRAALMNLGAFTPRSDHEWDLGEGASEEERGPMKVWVDQDRRA